MPRAVGGALQSPEDRVAQKLRWFELGERASERQWRDVVEVLRVQGSGLDVAVVHRLAAELGVTELLEKALIDSRR